jgi:hypothetical protein
MSLPRQHSLRASPAPSRAPSMQVRLASAADVATLHERLNSAVAETLKARSGCLGLCLQTGHCPAGRTDAPPPTTPDASGRAHACPRPGRPARGAGVHGGAPPPPEAHPADRPLTPTPPRPEQESVMAQVRHNVTCDTPDGCVSAGAARRRARGECSPRAFTPPDASCLLAPPCQARERGPKLGCACGHGHRCAGARYAWAAAGAPGRCVCGAGG